MSTDTGGHIHPKVVGLIDTELQRQAKEFEDAQVARIRKADTERNRQARRIQLQFWFLFGFLVVAFLILAWRTEVNSRDLQNAQARGCDRRAETAAAFNEGRLALINLVIATPANASLTPEEKAATVKTLKEGLILPVEDCSGYVRNN